VVSLNVVGPAVRKVRLGKQPPLTQEHVAIKLQVLGWDIDRFGVSKIERGKRQVTDRELLVLAEALDVSAAWLLGED